MSIVTKEKKRLAPSLGKLLTDWNNQGGKGVATHNTTIVHDILRSNLTAREGRKDRKQMPSAIKSKLTRIHDKDRACCQQVLSWGQDG